MEIVRHASEDEMIAVFLSAEVHSRRTRFGGPILSRLERDGMPRSVVDQPDLSDPGENTYRRQLLADYRGYGRNDNVFCGFPQDVNWSRVALNREELGGVKYLNYDYWVELSRGTRLLRNGAQTVRDGSSIFRVPNTGFWRAAEAVRRGATFPDPIAASVEGALVLLDGQRRMTGYLLAGDSCPSRIHILVGFSPGFVDWDANDFS